jgi:glycine/D-amino acid oxidase-like deaminating enzyme
MVADEAYHRFRYQSLAEYRRLDQELEGALGLQWGGALCFDGDDQAQDRRLERFRAFGYPVEAVSHNRFRELEPHYADPPRRALRSALEGSLEPIRATGALIAAAAGQGARTLYGADVTALKRDGARVIGLETGLGDLDAQTVILAAGIGAASLLATLDVRLPMADKPGVMLHSRPVDPILAHVIWGDRIHLKQQDDGRLIIGEIFSDGDASDQSAVLEAMLAEARRLLPGIDVEIERTTIATRPIPADGLPVVGRPNGKEGLYVAVMHSGVTLAPIIGRMAAEEILDGVTFEALAPYRPSRFS